MMAIEVKEYVGNGNIKHVVETTSTTKKTVKKAPVKKTAKKGNK